MNIRVFISFVFLAAIFGCKSKQQTAPSQSAPPPIATADTASKPSKSTSSEYPYRATNTRHSDIIHTRLEVSFDWTNSRLNGKATLKVKPHFYATDSLYLDARGMDINKLEVFEVAKVTETVATKKGKSSEPVEVWHKITNSAFKYDNDSLKINLGRRFKADEYYYVQIDYIAKPNELKNPGGSAAITEDKGLYFVNPSGENKFKMPQIWTQGETQSSSAWFPTIDSPNEKMTQEILMTVEDRFTTLSNGTLAVSTKNSDGTRTDHWKLDQPHAPYLVMMGVGEFKKVTDTPWKGKEVSYYVESDYEAHAKAIFGDTPEMIDFYSKVLGVDYPWPKYAQIVVKDYVSGAMENTSATLHGDFMVNQTTRETIDGKRGEAVIAHELFHQWFGDLVTCESWSNLPLNESFAVYGEYLWYEFKHGRAAADYHHWESRQSYLHAQKEVDLIRFHYNRRDDMFDAFSYAKGGQVLHMLRKTVGDEAFFASLKKYLETNMYKPVEIHNLRLAFEEVTGKDLNWFFNQWFLNKGRPKLTVTKTVVPGYVELTVEQTQDLSQYPLYRLPLYIDIYVNGKRDRRHVEISQKKETFKFKMEGTPELVNFDGERQLLADITYSKPKQELLALYKLGTLFEDRLEALKSLENALNDEDVYNLFRTAALNDSSPELRQRALFRIQKAPAEKLPDMKSLFLTVYEKDKSNPNRHLALKSLNDKFLNDADVIALNNKAFNEMSYRVVSEALRSLAKRDPKAALARAKTFEKEPGKDIIFAIAQIYADHGADDQIIYFQNALRYLSAFEIPSLLQSYVKTAKRCTSSTNVISVAMNLESVAFGSGKFVKYSAQKGVKDLATHWEERAKSLAAALESAKQQGKATPEMEMEVKAANDTKDILNQTAGRMK